MYNLTKNYNRFWLSDVHFLKQKLSIQIRQLNRVQIDLNLFKKKINKNKIKKSLSRLYSVVRFAKLTTSI